MKTNIKAKNGKSFPDLNKDGKITKADILKGRGVIAQNGKKMQGVKGMSENEKLKKGITKLAPVKDKPVKKAALGALLPLAMKAAPMVAGMLGGKGKGKSGGMGGMLGGLMGGKNGKTVKKAQTGKIVKKTKTSNLPMNTILPGMGIPNSAPKKVITSSAKVGKSVKKYQMGGFVSNEFAAKNTIKPTSNTKLVDSSIKKGKAINAFQGKKGMLAKSGTSMKKCKSGC